MLKLLFTLSFSITLGAQAFAKDITCSIVNDPSASTLLIQYAEDGTPFLLALKSPESSEYRALNMIIEPISLGSGVDSFSAKPELSKEIDWSKEPSCFKEIGTQWYFVLNFDLQKYSVYLTPALVTENNRCIPPRFSPQGKALDCKINN